jgi:hypothetical protein
MNPAFRISAGYSNRSLRHNTSVARYFHMTLHPQHIGWSNRLHMLDEFLAELREYPSLEPDRGGMRALLAANLPRRHAFTPRTEHLAGLSRQPQLRDPGMRQRVRYRGRRSRLDTLPVKPVYLACRVAHAERGARRRESIDFRQIVRRHPADHAVVRKER